MIQHNDTLIIGLDHGYGNMKTANHCFPTGIIPGEDASSFAQNILEYGGKSYLIGEGHKDFIPDKVKDDDFYHLTLAGIAEELDTLGLTEATIHITAGLPLTWTGAEGRLCRISDEKFGRNVHLPEEDIQNQDRRRQHLPAGVRRRRPIYHKTQGRADARRYRQRHDERDDARQRQTAVR